MLTAAEIAKRSLKRAGYIKPIVEKPLPNELSWIESNFYLYDTGNLITLADCQRRPLELALSKDGNGNYRYNTILWSWPKKSAKSSVIAAVADYIADNRMNASVKLVANDLKQADSRVGYYLRESILIGQRHGKRSNIVVTPSGYHIKYPNGAKVEAIPVDPAGEAGGNDDMIVFSELHAWKTKAHQRMWAEMTLSPNKFGRSQRWIDTYAGETGESPILEPLYEMSVKQGRKVWDDLEVYVNDAAGILAVWVTKPMFPWQTPAYYASEAATLTPDQFERMHRNKWASSSSAFVPAQWWEACKVESIADVGRRGVIIGIDAARANDSFAVVVVTSRSGKVQVIECRIWTPPEGGQIQFADIEVYLMELFKKYNCIEIAYDPTDLTSMSQRLSGLVYWREFLQAQPRAVADKLLYDLIRDQRIEHRGEVGLTEHILNANQKPEDEKIRIVKRSQTMKIDACVALAMASDRSLFYNL